MKRDLAPAFKKSSYSNDQGACVEVAELPHGCRGVRDSKHPSGAMLTFPAAQWSAFVAGVQDGKLG